MNTFYNYVLLVMSWVFLASAVVLFVVLLSLNNGEMSETWHFFLASILSCLFFAALSWAAYKMSKYIDVKNEEIEYSSNEYVTE